MPGFHPSAHARTQPDKLALVIADTGETLTYAELDAGSNRVARLLRSLGLKPGERVGVMMRNSPEFAKVYWGATRCGCFVTLLSTHLKPAEASYILGDCAAKVLILSASLGETPRALAADAAGLIPGVQAIYYADDEPIEGASSLSAALAQMPAEPVPDEISGFHLIYSSGTTGRPKGVVMPFTPGPIDEFNRSEGLPSFYDRFDPLVAFNAGPLYHGAPISGLIATTRLGGTFVTMRKFDAAGALRALQDWKVNSAQFGQLLVQFYQGFTDEFDPPVSPGQGVQDGRVEDKSHMNLTAVFQGLVERRVVVRPQIPAQPDQSARKRGVHGQ